MRRAAFLIPLLFVLVGCQQPHGGAAGPFGQGGGLWNNSSPALLGGDERVGTLSRQIEDLNARLSRYDADNSDLHTQIASLQQRLQLANDFNQQLRTQLNDNMVQLQQVQQARQQAEQQLAQLASGDGPMRLAGSATIRANNSLMDQLPRLNIDGAEARMDGDVIRVELSSDRLFAPGTYQIQPAHAAVLQQTAAAIRQHFPHQIVGVEAHWDDTPLAPGPTAAHQVTATQALAVVERLTAAGLPQRQVFTMGMAANRPRYPLGGPQSSMNRRVEIVIFPETFE